MADIVEKVLEEVKENVTETITGAKKPPASLEGSALAYGSLIIMAMLPIFFGALRSVKHQKEHKVCLTATHHIWRHLKCLHNELCRGNISKCAGIFRMIGGSGDENVDRYYPILAVQLIRHLISFKLSLIAFSISYTGCR